MCTVTVTRRENRVLVTMNRDERRLRTPELPPRFVTEPNGVTWVAPSDGESGGTWMGANDRGIIACLLNGNGNTTSSIGAGFASRGEIIPSIMSGSTPIESAARASRALGSAMYQPFTLLLLNVHRGAPLVLETGNALTSATHHQAWLMLSSSSWQPTDVLPWRRQQFDHWINEGTRFHGHIPAFHLFSPSGDESYAPLMSRTMSETLSISQIETGPHGIDFRYWHGGANSLRNPGNPRSLHLAFRKADQCLSESDRVTSPRHRFAPTITTEARA